MNILKKIRTGMVSLLFANAVFSQQDSQYTQYMYNTVSINPAYAGNRGMLSFNGIYRNQWVGLEGAPESLAFSGNTPIGRISGNGVGLGLSFFSDKIGPSTESNIAADFSYTIPLDEHIDLSFGIKGGLNLLDVDFSKLNPHNPTDSDLKSIDNRVSPIVGAGFYLHSRDRWYLGLSSPNLLVTEHYDDYTASTASEKTHIYLIGGYVFDLNRNLKFKPAFLTKAVVGAPIAWDVSANFLFHEKFTLGAAYRLDAAVSALAAFQVSDRIMIGYAYDYDTTDLGNYNSGSHEIFLRFELTTNTGRTVNPRFF